MPRLAKSEAEKQRITLVHNIENYINDSLRENVNRKKSQREDYVSLSKKLGFSSYSRLLKCRKEPEKITLGELQCIANLTGKKIGTLLEEV